MYYFSKVAFTLATQNCELIIQLDGTKHLCASHWLFCISPPFMPMSYKMLRSIWSNRNISHSPSVFYSHFLNSIAFQGRFDRSFNKSNFSNQGKYIIKLDKQSQMKSLALLESNSDSQVLAAWLVRWLYSIFSHGVFLHEYLTIFYSFWSMQIWLKVVINSLVFAREHRTAF